MTLWNEPLAGFWTDYLAELPPDHPHRGEIPDAFAFGGGGELADELAGLVLAGRKRATTSLPAEFRAAGEALPRAGSISVILNGRGEPVAIIERTSVELIPFGSVGPEYAAIEGEGDGSLRFWREAHEQYFGEVCRRLDGSFDDSTLVICQVFELVWPVADRDNEPHGSGLVRRARSGC